MRCFGLLGQCFMMCLLYQETGAVSLESRLISLAQAVKHLQTDNQNLKNNAEKLENKLISLQEEIVELKHENVRLQEKIEAMTTPQQSTFHQSDREFVGVSDKNNEELKQLTDTRDRTLNLDKNRSETVMNQQPGSTDYQTGLHNVHIKKGKRKRLALATAVVAFHAFLTNNRCFNDHQVIDFDGEELDTHNAYNEHDGIFIVPESGIYVFSWLFLAQHQEVAKTELVVNGVARGWTISDSLVEYPFFNPSSNLVVLNMHTGDHVMIRRVAGRGCDAMGQDSWARTTFSGWKLG